MDLIDLERQLIQIRRRYDKLSYAKLWTGTVFVINEEDLQDARDMLDLQFPDIKHFISLGTNGLGE